MWTYLIILLSLSLVLGIFFRRLYLYNKGPVAPIAELVEESELPEKKRISKANRARAEALSKKGDRLIKAGKEDEAIKCFVQALAIDALHQETQHKLAVLYLQKHLYGAAAALFKQLSEISPDPVHFSHLGLALYSQSDFENAKSAYQKAVELDDSRPQRFVSHFENAKSAYQKAVELDDSRPQRFVSLSQVYRSTGQLQHAVIALNKALAIEGDNMEFLFLMADLQISLGNTEGAKEILKKVLEIEPNNKDASAMLKGL